MGRMENLNEINDEIINEARKKRKISIDPDVEIDNCPNTKKIKLEPEAGVPSPVTENKKGATKRQMDALREKEEKERREKEKGPGWYYELVPVTNPQVPPE